MCGSGRGGSNLNSSRSSSGSTWYDSLLSVPLSLSVPPFQCVSVPVSVVCLRPVCCLFTFPSVPVVRFRVCLCAMCAVCGWLTMPLLPCRNSTDVLPCPLPCGRRAHEECRAGHRPRRMAKFACTWTARRTRDSTKPNTTAV